MKKQRGFTLVEIVTFIVVTGILASAVLTSLVYALKNTPTLHDNMVATRTAEQCMEWFIGQRRLNGYSSVSTGTSVPSFCTAPTGYNAPTVDVSALTISGDSNFKSITLQVTGKGDMKDVYTIIAMY